MNDWKIKHGHLESRVGTLILRPSHLSASELHSLCRFSIHGRSPIISNREAVPWIHELHKFKPYVLVSVYLRFTWICNVCKISFFRNKSKSKIPAKRSIHGGNYSMQSHRFYIPPSCTKTMKQKYPIISAIDDKWRWDCVAIPNLMIWLFCFIIFHEPMPPHSPTAVSDGTLPGAKPGHQIRQTKIHLRLACQAQGRCRLLTFFPIFDGGTPGCPSQQQCISFLQRVARNGPFPGPMFSLISWYPKPWQALHDNWERTVQSSEWACASQFLYDDSDEENSDILHIHIPYKYGYSDIQYPSKPVPGSPSSHKTSCQLSTSSQVSEDQVGSHILLEF